MKNVALSLLVLLTTITVSAEGVFPGAVGFGVDTPAGRGGEIIRVTNLDAKGPGSLRAALQANGPRIVVFEVAGVIDLDRKGLHISEPFLTVAGQTAPSPGVTIIRGGIGISTHDVLLQHIRVRPGDAGQPKKSGWEPDGITTSGGDAYNIVIDHCSVTWAVDENMSASGPRLEGVNATSHRITFSNNIIAEALHDSSHVKGPHSKGSLIHDFCTDIAIIGNLYAHNVDRNPYFKAYTTGAIVNNVIYNPGNAAIRLTYHLPEWEETDLEPVNARVSVVGNVLHHGVDTRRRMALVGNRGDAYIRDNLAFAVDGSPLPITEGKIVELDRKPVWPESLQPQPAGRVLESVLRNAGARPWERDAIDARIVEQTRTREGRVIHSQNEVGGYPVLEPVQRAIDIPEDGVDAWLAKFTPEDY